MYHLFVCILGLTDSRVCRIFHPHAQCTVVKRTLATKSRYESLLQERGKRLAMEKAELEVRCWRVVLFVVLFVVCR